MLPVMLHPLLDLPVLTVVLALSALISTDPAAIHFIPSSLCTAQSLPSPCLTPTISHRITLLPPQLTINLPGGVAYTAVPNAPGLGAPLRAVTVRDAIADLPAIENGFCEEEQPYKVRCVFCFCFCVFCLWVWGLGRCVRLWVCGVRVMCVFVVTSWFGMGGVVVYSMLMC